MYTYTYIGARWRSWLRHSATSWEVAGSIPDVVVGIVHRRNPSGRTIALRATQPLTEMSTRYISWGIKWLVRRVDNLITFMCLNLLVPSGPVHACTGITLPLYIYIYIYICVCVCVCVCMCVCVCVRKISLMNL